ncbi:MAG: BatD family protein [Mariprofundaceae bacterium]|nr:BatD family protein [Mariprofundaceae bacterium]
MVKYSSWILSYIMLSFACLFMPTFAMAGSAIASLDRSSSISGESVQLSIHVDGSSDKDPDFSPLNNDFEILNKSQRSSYQFINGSMSRSKDWQINLMPKHTGILSIPAISLGNMKTKALTLQVLEQAQQTNNTQNRDVFLEVSASPTDSYVQAQVVFKVRLFRAVNLAQAQLSEPEIPHSIIKRLGKDKTYETVRNQRRFVVTERNYAIFPQQSGNLKIPPIEFSGQVADNRSFFNQAGRTLRVSSKAVELKISPMPTTWPSGDAWLPSEGVSIKEVQTDDSDLKVGEPITRTIEIRARGLTAEQLPQLLSIQNIDGLKQYPDKPKLKTELDEHGVIGERREKIAMIPTKKGDIRLPEISIAWWNTQTHKIQYAKILGRTISIKEGAVKSSLQTNSTNTIAAPSVALPVTKAQTTPLKIQTDLQTALNNDNLTLWQTISACLALGWLLTIAFWWFSKHPIKASVHEDDDNANRRQLKALQHQLKRACYDKDAQSSATLLVEWARCFHEKKDIYNVGQLKGQSDLLDAALNDLELCLYSPNKQLSWHGDLLWKAVESIKKQETIGLQDDSLKAL